MSDGIVKPPLGALLNLDHPLAQGLCGCWLFQEGAGNKAYDSSGQGNHGTLVNMANPPTSTSGWGPGPHGGALAFGGFEVNENYVISPNSPIPTLSQEITVEAWVTMSLVQTFHYYPGVLMKSANGATGFVFQFWSSSNKIKLYINGVSISWVASANTVVPLGILTHIAATWNGATLQYYFNGKPDGSFNITGSWVHDDSPFMIGIGMNNWPFQGNIHKVAQYNRALSAAEIAYLYAFPYCMFEDAGYPAWMVPPAASQYYYRHLLAGGRI